MTRSSIVLAFLLGACAVPEAEIASRSLGRCTGVALEDGFLYSAAHCAYLRDSDRLYVFPDRDLMREPIAGELQPGPVTPPPVGTAVTATDREGVPRHGFVAGYEDVYALIDGLNVEPGDSGAPVWDEAGVFCVVKGQDTVTRRTWCTLIP